MKKEDICPCNSGKPFGECCGPVLEGEREAQTPEALMRARYSAYVTGNIPFLKTSAVKAVQDEFDERSSEMWSRAAKWHGLEIIRTEMGGPGDVTGVVEFRAVYTANGEFCNHHEVATFVREGGGWKFEDGELVGETPMTRDEPKIGRNDPCPCGSGKKYKKCCGRG
jgi:SEC-C motif-containing protein